MVSILLAIVLFVPSSTEFVYPTFDFVMGNPETLRAVWEADIAREFPR